MDAHGYVTSIPLFDELRGEQVVVRPYRESDAQDVYEAIVESREHLRPWMPWAGSHQTVEESKDWIIRRMADWLTRNDLTLGMWEAGGDGRYLGGTGLHPRNWSIRYFEIGYWIRTSAEGHGYVTEAVRMLTDYALDELKASRVMIRCDERNVRSAAIPRRLGYVYEGAMRNYDRDTDGNLFTMLIFSRIPGDEGRSF